MKQLTKTQQQKLMKQIKAQSARNLKRTSIALLRKQWQDYYLNKYTTLFLNLFKFKNMKPYESVYIMRKLLETATLAAFKAHISEDVEGDVVFAGYTPKKYLLYGRPASIKPVNEYNLEIIPDKYLRNGIEASIITLDYQPLSVINTFVNQMVDLRMTYNTNVKLHKMPFIIEGGDAKQTNAIEELLDDSVVIQTELGDVRTINTGFNSILDKLQDQMIQTEHELLTVLGVDNVKYEKRAQMNIDEINANNEEINAFRVSLKDRIQAWFDEINDLFGTNFEIEKQEIEIKSIHEEGDVEDVKDLAASE